MDRTSETNWQTGQPPGAARPAAADPPGASSAKIPVWIHIPDLSGRPPQPNRPVALPGPLAQDSRTSDADRPAGRPKKAPRRRVPSAAVLGGVVTAIVALAVLLLRGDSKKEGPTMNASPPEAAYSAHVAPNTQVVTNQDPTATTEAKTAYSQPLPVVGGNRLLEARGDRGGTLSIGRGVPTLGDGRPGSPPGQSVADQRSEGSNPAPWETARGPAAYETSHSVRPGDLGPAVQHIYRIDPVQPIRR